MFPSDQPAKKGERSETPWQAHMRKEKELFDHPDKVEIPVDWIAEAVDAVRSNMIAQRAIRNMLPPNKDAQYTHGYLDLDEAKQVVTPLLLERKPLKWASYLSSERELWKTLDEQEDPSDVLLTRLPGKPPRILSDRDRTVLNDFIVAKQAQIGRLHAFIKKIQQGAAYLHVHGEPTDDEVAVSTPVQEQGAVRRVSDEELRQREEDQEAIARFQAAIQKDIQTKPGEKNQPTILLSAEEKRVFEGLKWFKPEGRREAIAHLLATGEITKALQAAIQRERWYEFSDVPAEVPVPAVVSERSADRAVRDARLELSPQEQEIFDQLGALDPHVRLWAIQDVWFTPQWSQNLRENIMEAGWHTFYVGAQNFMLGEPVTYTLEGPAKKCRVVGLSRSSLQRESMDLSPATNGLVIQEIATHRVIDLTLFTEEELAKLRRGVSDVEEAPKKERPPSRKNSGTKKNVKLSRADAQLAETKKAIAASAEIRRQKRAEARDQRAAAKQRPRI